MIPVFEPHMGEEEVQAVADAVRAGEISGTFGENIPASSASSPTLSAPLMASR